MKKVQIISEGANFSAVNIGSINEVADYVVHHPALPPSGVPGKVFLGETLKATCMEVSFQVMPPHSETCRK